MIPFVTGWRAEINISFDTRNSIFYIYEWNLNSFRSDIFFRCSQQKFFVFNIQVNILELQYGMIAIDGYVICKHHCTAARGVYRLLYQINLDFRSTGSFVKITMRSHLALSHLQIDFSQPLAEAYHIVSIDFYLTIVRNI